MENPRNEGVAVREGPGHVEISLTRVDKANAMSVAMVSRLAAAVGAQSRLPIVIRSAHPRVFCAGADIDEFRQGAHHLHEQGEALGRLVAAMAQSPAPILTLLHGKAAGVGVMLVALSDVVVARADASLAAPEIRFGMYPVAVEVVLAARVGAALAAGVCLSGAALDARRGLELGLVTQVAESDQAQDEALAHFLQRPSALAAARASRLLDPAHAGLPARLAAVLPLMHANFSDARVLGMVERYMAGLKG